MLRNRLLLKAFATFLILEILTNTVAPTLSYALTAGPTAPEFSSFEPVDTTDIVNLATGELVYNMPLLEVPGPSGGYPLSLSYHAGIRPDSESSWVGLGFTLNPGAINRFVSGFADDNVVSRRDIRDFWDGGSSTTKTYTLGLSIPSTGIGVSYTLANTRDTYKGFSSNGSAGIHINPIALAVNIANGTFGSAFSGSSESEISNSINNADELAKANKAAGIAYATLGNPLSGYVKYGINTLTGNTSLDFAISSKGIKANATVAGHTFGQKNSSAGKISSFTESKNLGAIPLFGFGQIGLKEFYTRYWSDQSDVLFGTGTLYPYIGNSKLNSDQWASDIENENDEFQSYAFDTYNLYDKSDFGINDDADPSKQIGGTLPAYDQYTVVAQGLGGSMQPYIFENGDLHGQNTYFQNPFNSLPLLDYPTLKHKVLRSFTEGRKVDFRFQGDFSNSLTVSPSQINFDGTNFSVQGHSVQAVSEGFDNTSTRQKLAGSKHIEWFTNQEIVDGTAQTYGFIDYYPLKTDRPLEKAVYRDYLQPEACIPYNKSDYTGRNNGIIKTDTYEETDIYSDIISQYSAAFSSLKPDMISLAQKIGGFMITNESGVTYHYSLPVYGSNEYTRTKLKKPKKGAATITEIKNEEPYAYTWLLTAVTGPDYVDRGGTNGSPNGILDDEDWGYWVKFDYGKWTSSYQWRTPFSGYMSDVESEYESFSYGIKELYYLDAIETKSHKAIFIKSKRKDGKGVTSRLEGGSNPRKYKMTYLWSQNQVEVKSASLTFSVSPVSTMKLDAIYLFDKRDLNTLALSKSTGNKYNEAPDSSPHIYGYTGNDYTYQVPYSPQYITIKQGEDAIKVSYHNGNNVFDDGDIQDMPDFRSKAIRIIELNTDYSLAKGVPNSFGYFTDIQAAHPNRQCLPPLGGNSCIEGNYTYDFEWPLAYHPTNPNACVGISVNPYCCNWYFIGFDGPELFDGYDLSRNAFYQTNPLGGFGYSNNNNNCPDAEGRYQGDKIKYFRTGKLTLKGISVLGKGGQQLLPPTVFAYGKNPDYAGNAFDEWGYFKSDYQDITEINPGSSTILSPSGESYEVSTSVGSRRITDISAQHVDAWSLTEIQSSLGSTTKITYQPNSCFRSVYNDFNSFGIEKVERVISNKVRIYFKEKGINLNDYFTVGQPVDIKAFIVYDLGNYNPGANNYVDSRNVTQINQDNIVIDAPALYTYLGSGQTYVDPATGTSYNNPKPYFLAGLVTAQDITEKYTGGVRVEAITVSNIGGDNITEYLYNTPGTLSSSGVTSYKPHNQVGIKIPTEINFFDKILSDKDKQSKRKKLLEYKTQFQKLLNEPFKNILTFGREAPAPGALYEYVTVKSRIDNQYSDIYTVNHFQPFDEGMISITTSDYGTSSKQRRNITLRNTAVDVGNILDISTFSTGDNNLLHKVIYGYLYGDGQENFELPITVLKQGVIEQSFQKNITVQYIQTSSGCVPGNCTITQSYKADKAVVTKREDRSNVLTSVKEIDYKTGINSTSYNLAFDYYSGTPLKKLIEDGYGNWYITETVPAYTKYPSMGLKVKAVNPTTQRHMLSQVASTYTYKVDPTNSENKIGLVSASTQTWSNQLRVLNENEQPAIWRKHATYNYVGNDNAPLNYDGLHTLTNNQLPTFTAWNKDDATPQHWQKSAEIGLYDVHSHALEARDINGLFAATKMSADQTRVVATAANSKYCEFAYLSAEDVPVGAYNGGGVSIIGHGIRVSDEAHTGEYSIRVNQGNSSTLVQATSSEITPGKKYFASVWVKYPSDQVPTGMKLSVNFDGNTSFATIKANRQIEGWHLVELTFETPAAFSNMTIAVINDGSNNGYFDDFRFHPYDASMTSYVYNQWGELTHILDNNNLYIHYLYDAMGRLVSTYKESFSSGIVKTAESTYKYSGQND